MVDFLVEITADLNGVDLLFAALSSRLSPGGLAEFLDDHFDPFLRTRTANRFSGEGDDVTGAWMPLRASTEAIRARKGYSPAHPINVRDHIMRDFLVNEPGETKRITDGATLDYPGSGADPLTEQKIATAQGGKSYPQTPPRPVLGLGPTDLEYLQSELVQYMFGGL